MVHCLCYISVQAIQNNSIEILVRGLRCICAIQFSLISLTKLLGILALSLSSIASMWRISWVGGLCLGETAVEKQVCQCNSSGQWFWTWMDQRDGSWWERGGGTNLPYPHLKSSTHREAICWLHGCLWKCFCEWLRKSRWPVQSKHCVCGRRATSTQLSRSLSGVCYPQQIIQEHKVLSWPACHAHLGPTITPFTTAARMWI